jgi:hypothetical protein
MRTAYFTQIPGTPTLCHPSVTKGMTVPLSIFLAANVAWQTTEGVLYLEGGCLCRVLQARAQTLISLHSLC